MPELSSVATVLGALISILLWIVLSLYLAGDLYWIYEMLVYGWRYEPPDRVYDASDVQVRILTIDNESVVRKTVDHLPLDLDERYVVAEEPMQIPGATVAVVPNSFDCTATNKGRALEWARRALPCDREFILYLDEDSYVLEFDGLPDADIVQLTEKPRKTSHWLTYFAELNRVGFQIEQRSFPSVLIPLYAWGGGLAIRTSLEDEITWNYDTVIEDTVFVWRAFVDANATYAYVPDRVSNQAPPSLRSMFRQRRRWIAGAREDNDILSLDRVLMYGVRDLSWSVTGLIPIIALVSIVPFLDVVFLEYYRTLSLALFSLLYVWVLIGVLVYKPPWRIAIAVVLLAPITTVLHSIGALWGLLSPPDTFQVTDKVCEKEPVSPSGSPDSATTDEMRAENAPPQS